MIENKKVLAVIPARGGSQGISRKNMKTISGKPMVVYTVEAARECQYIDKVIVSTDDEEIADISMRNGAIVPFSRPEELATNEARLIDVVMHAVNFYDQKGEMYDIIVVLPPSSPLRTTDDIQRALEYYIKSEEQSIVSVTEVRENPILMRSLGENNKLVKLLDEDSSVRRQDMKKYYRVNGAIYINSKAELSASTSLNDNVIGFVMPKEHGIDVVELEDVVVAEYYLSQECNAEFLYYIVY